MKKQDLILLIAILVLSAILALGFFLLRDGGTFNSFSTLCYTINA